jgi:hypothetical protein
MTNTRLLFKAGFGVRAAERGIEFGCESVDISVFSSELEVEELSLRPGAGHPDLSASLVEV